MKPETPKKADNFGNKSSQGQSGKQPYIQPTQPGAKGPQQPGQGQAKPQQKAPQGGWQQGGGNSGGNIGGKGDGRR